MNLIKNFLEKQNALILDGALGTQMQNHGFNINDSLWSAKFLDENPNAIKLVHKEYLEAGADCIITSSYQASLEGFLEKGFSEEKADHLISSSIKIAKDTRDEFWESYKNSDRLKPLVAASIGPYGAYLANGAEYSGAYEISEKKLSSFHKRRLDTIMKMSPDIIACETIPLFSEIKILSKLLEKYKTTTSWLCLSAKNESLTNAGDDVEEVISWLNAQKHIDAIGVNCTAPQYISTLVKKIKKLSDKLIVIYPNGGSAYNPITKLWESSLTNSEEFAKMAYLWNSLGANIIGGCCETTPKEIKKIREYLLKK